MGEAWQTLRDSPRHGPATRLGITHGASFNAIETLGARSSGPKDFPTAGPDSRSGGMGQKIRILLADDHAVVRQGLGRILAAEPDMEIIAEAANGREAVERAEDLKPDVVVMDVAMPEVNGIEATRALMASSPQIKILAVSMHKEAVYVREILRAGARGYLIKDAQDQDLVEAVRALWQGKGYISPAIAESVLVDYRKHVNDPVDRLTVREREVLRLIAEGKTNKEIAASLNLSVYTVDAHRGNIMEKLNLRSAAEIVRFAMRNGLID